MSEEKIVNELFERILDEVLMRHTTDPNGKTQQELTLIRASIYQELAGKLMEVSQKLILWCAN